MNENELFRDLEPLQFSGVDMNPLVIAGPCSAETEEQMLTTAQALSQAGISIFRAGLWKPRTRPGGFEGVGDKGLPWMQRVKQETGMLTATEVATRDHVEAALAAGIDVLWIGTRTTANPFAVQEIADALQGHPEVTVLVKNPINPDIELWIGALQRIYSAGIHRLAAVHRGFSTYASHPYRNEPQWHIPIELQRRLPQLPLLCDPSHIGGKREYVATLSQYAMDMGFDGLIIEAHCNPDNALSDSQQQVTPAELKTILENLVVRERNAKPDQLAYLREIIDYCDNELLEVLYRRMKTCREIGTYKHAHNLQVVQSNRYAQMLEQRVNQGKEYGLSPEFVKTIMQVIHEESVALQLAIINQKAKK